MTMTMTNTIARSPTRARVYLTETDREREAKGQKGGKRNNADTRTTCLSVLLVCFVSFFGLFPRSIDRSGRVGRIVQRERRLLDRQISPVVKQH